MNAFRVAVIISKPSSYFQVLGRIRNCFKIYKSNWDTWLDFLLSSYSRKFKQMQNQLLPDIVLVVSVRITGRDSTQHLALRLARGRAQWQRFLLSLLSLDQISGELVCPLPLAPGLCHSFLCNLWPRGQRWLSPPPQRFRCTEKILQDRHCHRCALQEKRRHHLCRVWWSYPPHSVPLPLTGRVRESTGVVWVYPEAAARVCPRQEPNPDHPVSLDAEEGPALSLADPSPLSCLSSHALQKMNKKPIIVSICF